MIKAKGRYYKNKGKLCVWGEKKGNRGTVEMMRNTRVGTGRGRSRTITK